MTTTNPQAQAVRNPASPIPLRVLSALLALCLLGFGQSNGSTPAPGLAPSIGPPSTPAPRPSWLSPASFSVPGPLGTTETQLARWEEMRRISRAHLRLAESWLNDGRLPEARAELDLALETLLGDARVDFAANAECRRAVEDLITEIHRLEVTRMGIGDQSTTPVYQESPLDQIPELTFPIDPKLKATVVDQIRAQTGAFPLEVNDVVLSYVRYFTSERGARTFVAGYRRSGRYRNMILRILDEEGLPRELLYLAQAESGFLPRAISRAAAGGLWQFIVSRGREYGLSQSTYTDDRFDPEKATRAAARHLRDLFHDFGDWNLAMAAYNCGPACVSRAVARTGYADFWELRRLNVIPRETTNYVPIVQALAIISLNPSAYGIELPELDPPLLFDTHLLESKTNLNLIADLIGITPAEIRDLNPSVRKDIAPAGYALRVPKQTVPVLLSGLSQVPVGNRVAWRAHRVDRGDTLTTIAKQYRTTSSAIQKVNELSEASMQEGDLLLIPASYSTAKKSTRKKTVRRSTSSRKKTTSTKKPVKSNKKTSVSRKPAATKSTSKSRAVTPKRATASNSAK